MNWYRADPHMTGREILLHDITVTGPTPENGRDGVSLDIRICNFLKAVRQMRLRAAPPSTRMWYGLMLMMVGKMSSDSYPAPAMFLGQHRHQSQSVFASTCGSALPEGQVELVPPLGTGSS
jgi:hypothetical protein